MIEDLLKFTPVFKMLLQESIVCIQGEYLQGFVLSNLLRRSPEEQSRCYRKEGRGELAALLYTSFSDDGEVCAIYDHFVERF